MGTIIDQFISQNDIDLLRWEWLVFLLLLLLYYGWQIGLIEKWIFIKMKLESASVALCKWCVFLDCIFKLVHNLIVLFDQKQQHTSDLIRSVFAYRLRFCLWVNGKHVICMKYTIEWHSNTHFFCSRDNSYSILYASCIPICLLIFFSFNRCRWINSERRSNSWHVNHVLCKAWISNILLFRPNPSLLKWAFGDKNHHCWH